MAMVVEPCWTEGRRQRRLGINVLGNTNTLNKNVVGASGLANVLGGILVNGTGNTLTENSANYNTGPGFNLTGGSQAAPNNLMKNNKAANNKVGVTPNNFALND
jgi:hypothetical protein